MTPVYWIMIAITVLFTLLGMLSAWRTGDTKWPFVFGFFSILPVTIVLAVQGEGAAWRRWMIVALVAAYVARMLYTLLIWFNATGAAKLKDQVKPSQFLVLPLVLVPVFCWLYPLPFFAAMDRTDPFGLYDALTLICYALGTLFHLGADYQKWAFKQNPENRGKLLHGGFWGLSRHPNYFGDFLIYLSFALVSVWPWGLVAPVVNLLQYFFDAIPKNEKLSQERHGENWARYCRSTPLFLPYGAFKS
ncbi:DUF1295 domain-containing protein [Thioclava sp. GXIMD4216]|uniref:DUF1295 domain-containing protein n=1 Tax=Thioclava sp. GXIMD4216 TaxID=3131929 RepID=UPI0030D3C870